MTFKQHDKHASIASTTSHTSGRAYGPPPTQEFIDELVAEAERLSELGLPALPVTVDKKPLVEWERLSRTMPSREWREHHFRRPGVAGIAVLSGLQFVVLDVESPSLDVLHGRELPMTPIARTQAGGLHVYFRAEGVRSTSFAVAGRHAGDVKASGGYVILPPSRGRLGEYRWVPGQSLFEVPLASPPAWLFELVPSACAASARKSHSGGATMGSSSPPLVTPPRTHSVGSYASRSEEDAALVRRLFIAGQDPAEIEAVIANRPAALDRGVHGPAYAARTVENVLSWTRQVEVEARRRALPARVVRVDELGGEPPRVRVSFQVDFDDGTSKTVARPIDWPMTARSRSVWAALTSACGLPATSPPVELLGLEVCLDLRQDGGGYRVGRVYAPERGRRC